MVDHLPREPPRPRAGPGQVLSKRLLVGTLLALAVAVVLVVTTVAIAIAAEIRRRNAASRAMEAARLAQQADVEMAGGLRPQEAAAQ